MVKNYSMNNYTLLRVVNRRMNLLPNSSCINDVIQNVMDESSPYAIAYKYMHEVEQEQGSACAENRTPREVRLHFKRGPDQRRYNEPTHDELFSLVKMVPHLLIEML